MRLLPSQSHHHLHKRNSLVSIMIFPCCYITALTTTTTIRNLFHTNARRGFRKGTNKNIFNSMSRCHIRNHSLRQLYSSSSSSSSSPIITTSADITDIIRAESQEQYDKLMDHYMFELGNDIVFLSNQAEVSEYIDQNFDTILFDCDGVLYRGTDSIPNASASLLSLLTRQNKKVLFVTNNAGSNRKQLRDKLTKILQCPSDLLKEEQMVCSSYSAAKFLHKTLCPTTSTNTMTKTSTSTQDFNVHVIGTSGLCDEIRQFGFRVSTVSNDQKSSMSREELAEYTFAQEEEQPGNKVDAVVVGLDTEFNYRKLCIANVLLQRHPNALFIATNEDAFDLVGFDARHLPGNGSLVKAIEYSSGRKAMNVGKPSKILAHLLSEEHGFDPRRTLMVGDRLDTDVKFGKDGGMSSALVLTGCVTADQLIAIGEGTNDEPLPHIIFPHMGMMGAF